MKSLIAMMLVGASLSITAAAATAPKNLKGVVTQIANGEACVVYLKTPSGLLGIAGESRECSRLGKALRGLQGTPISIRRAALQAMTDAKLLRALQKYQPATYVTVTNFRGLLTTLRQNADRAYPAPAPHRGPGAGSGNSDDQGSGGCETYEEDCNRGSDDIDGTGNGSPDFGSDDGNSDNPDSVDGGLNF